MKNKILLREVTHCKKIFFRIKSPEKSNEHYLYFFTIIVQMFK